MPAPILVITGPPGTGKTSAARRVAARHELSAVVHGDLFFDALESGRIPPFLEESGSQNDRIIDITASAAAGYASGGWTTVLEGVFGPWYLPDVERVTADAGVGLHVAFLAAPLEICQQRVLEREGSDATIDFVRVMHAKFVETVQWETIDATAPVDRVATRIDTAFRSGALRWPREP